jgi:NitT/TauT family transport system substrate-binding protein
MVSLLTRYPGLALLVDTKYKDQIKSVKDLAGKKVGASAVGGASHQFLLTLLKANGMEAGSINFLPVGLNAPEIFSQGNVVATVTLEPFITQTVQSGQAVVLVDSRKPDGTAQVYGVPEIAWHALVTRKDVIASNPDLVKQTAQAIQHALETIATENVDALVSQTPKEMYPGGDAALFAQMLSANRAAFSADGRLTQKLMEPVWANMQAQGAAPKDKPLPFAETVYTP